MISSYRSVKFIGSMQSIVLEHLCWPDIDGEPFDKLWDERVRVISIVRPIALERK